jgi:hypothetical protein
MKFSFGQGVVVVEFKSVIYNLHKFGKTQIFASGGSIHLVADITLGSVGRDEIGKLFAVAVKPAA